MRLEGKVAVITGTSSGMGRATAKLFAAEGAKVVGIARRKGMLEELAEEIKAAGGTFVPYPGDVSIQAQAEGVMTFAVEKFGKLDIAYLNAGIADGNYPIAEVTDEHWNNVIGTDLIGVFWGARKATQIMVEQGYGNIITTASVGGLFGSVAGTAYVASKFAVVGITSNIAYFYGPKGIRANAICPGGIASEIVTLGKGQENPSKYGNERMMMSTTTCPYPASCDEIANAALFLASDDSKFINGTTLVVDGGWKI